MMDKMESLFHSDDLETQGSKLNQTSFCLEEEMERFGNQEQLHAILDYGANPEDFLSDYESKLQVAESRAIDHFWESICLKRLYNILVEVCSWYLLQLPC